MAKNIEIKARARDFEQQLATAKTLCDGATFVLDQRDVFYRCHDGRLKLRFENDDPPVLVAYHRPDQDGPKLSDYLLYESRDGQQLDATLAKVLGRLGVVCKHRRVYMVGQTRVHMDQVEGLGDFIELEVVLETDQSTEEGTAIAQQLMRQLGIRKEDLLTGAYFDMLQQC